ncbi:hypothetical protein Hsw_1648 [Hymenobacter swuensis DY53]|uniref:Uncharacterized protein n=1 Tax=Hymenobacter swuensis DY53 TaxID=1227739 RepID=W8EXD4_9BACT|nr:hypothetical protein Hsw_1648 [Hymenobacter swuensis DY53]
MGGRRSISYRHSRKGEEEALCRKGQSVPASRWPRQKRTTQRRSAVFNETETGVRLLWPTAQTRGSAQEWAAHKPEKRERA